MVFGGRDAQQSRGSEGRAGQVTRAASLAKHRVAGSTPVTRSREFSAGLPTGAFLLFREGLGMRRLLVLRPTFNETTTGLAAFCVTSRRSARRAARNHRENKPNNYS